jgi:hypothetical protein
MRLSTVISLITIILLLHFAFWVESSSVIVNAASQSVYRPPSPTVEAEPLDRLPKCSAFTNVAPENDAKPASPERWVTTCKEGGTLIVIYDSNANSSLRSPIVGPAFLMAHITGSPPHQSVRFSVMQRDPNGGVVTFRVLSWWHP